MVEWFLRGDYLAAIRLTILELSALQSAPLVGRLKLMKATLVHAAFAANGVGAQEEKPLFLAC